MTTKSPFLVLVDDRLNGNHDVHRWLLRMLTPPLTHTRQIKHPVFAFIKVSMIGSVLVFSYGMVGRMAQVDNDVKF